VVEGTARTGRRLLGGVAGALSRPKRWVRPGDDGDRVDRDGGTAAVEDDGAAGAGGPVGGRFAD
jgi:hypothetical protein